MSNPALYRRVVRRETHSPRSGLAITIAIVLVVVLAWLGTESVLAAIGQPALLVAPQDAVTAVLSAAAAPAPLLVALGAVVAVVGLVLIVMSLAPARRGRRGATIDRTAAIVDDRVIAQSLANTASYAGDVDPSQVTVSVGARRARVEITRTSGRTLNTREIQEAVDAELATYDYRPALRATVRLSEKGTVG
ncbi:hypothetical protein [Labedella endophytica]|uniref:DNA/RNA endonuclease G n=1 Tax=Labedella endophytica TaxID=1523160 RepID=A0A433JVQ2_9MICO|nr:hypothetical protein [Labedella endophytica]RUR03075.1 hypothetical protein ELQ94_00510 [Labedella endophytica]